SVHAKGIPEDSQGSAMLEPS
ncbi:hypothetical protein CPC197_0547B, partial [Chlamydia psittaci C1/97]